MTLDILHTQHERHFAANRFVYPVLSRRAGGISVGINLNPDKVCNFDCVYCQVNRVSQSETRFVEIPQLVVELQATLDLVQSGALFAAGKFEGTPPPLRRLSDIAFSGDGEPTTHRNFDEVVAACAEVKQHRRLESLPLVLITNASMFHRPHIQRALALLDAHAGEIWAKLDAGSEAYFARINRSALSLPHILANITQAARVRPLVIQSLFMRIDGQPPPRTEWSAFAARLTDMLSAGARFKLVQIYTIARTPAEPNVGPLSAAEVDQLVDYVRQQTGLPVAGFYGTAAD
ncbi:MAG: radical SAM protein [Pirellulaceae bacterium]|jgi:wyosine [tRNA(Phe)-imidazoG37] synthetase (radical SAM superfamily)|nr:radical SAM protein [Pirellulaceae bacterium]